MTANQIASKSAKRYWETPVSAKGQRYDLEQVIKSAIEEATKEERQQNRKLSRRCFDLTEENAELLSQSRATDDTGAERAANGIAREVLHQTSAAYSEGDVIERIALKYIQAISQRPIPATASDTKRLDWLEAKLIRIKAINWLTPDSLRAALDAAMNEGK